MIGTKLAHFQITAHLGSGGMGDVYQATDSKLGRSVAIKLLPEAFARDSERVARFEREARVLASLNHPNIAGIHGLERVDGRMFLVMEFVPGETLAQRINKGRVPVDEALGIAKQIAEGLEAAHEKGVVHRDLKPANVKITPDGRVKVLDFGLAKAYAPEAAGSADLSNSPTLMSAPSMPGVILGTAAYMSPEQAKGRKVDKRTDIFAFGCVLYEMLTGTRTFDGDDVTDILGAVLRMEPDWARLPVSVPFRIRELLRLCLEKNPKNRRSDATDVRIDIEQALKDPDGATLPAVHFEQTPWRRALPAVITGIVVAAITAILVWSLRPAPPAAALTRFSFTLPKDQNFTRTGRHVLTISPDGTNVVYVANNQLYLRSMAEAEAKAIPGTNQNVNTPFFSPDGQWLGFEVLDGKLKKIAITGGASVTLADIGNPYGATWYSADRILIGQGGKGIVGVSANGGKPETVIAVKKDEEAQTPQVLPDGDNVLFTLTTGTGDDRWDKAQIVVQSVKSGQRKILIEGGSDARYVPNGHIVYALGSTLFAVPFDAKKLQVTGGPVPIVEGISRAVLTGAAFFAFSDNGSLVFVPGDTAGINASSRALALVSRNGEKKPLGIPPMLYYQPRISPDGKQLAAQTLDSRDSNIWIYELSGATSMRRLTFAGQNRDPIWTPDSQRVVFTSSRESDNSLFWQRADGSGVAERLTTAEQGTAHWANCWSPDGKTLIFHSTKGILWMLNLDGDRKPKVLVEVPQHQAGNADFSPDGRWIAYESNESGKNEVWVQPFPTTGAKYQVSTNGGRYARWSVDGRQLFYIPFDSGGRERIAAVDVRTQPSFAFGPPQLLPLGDFVNQSERDYDITPDGKQFLVMLPPSDTASGDHAPLRINVVLNWFEDLKRRVPAK